MASASQWFLRLLIWRPNWPAPVRWAAASVLLVVAFAARLWIGTLHGASPALVFYPVILVLALFLGWKEALAVLAVAVALGADFLLPPGNYLTPVVWIVVGSMNIAIVTGLKALAEQLSAASERQRLLFQELQHRIANTLQMVVSSIDVARRRIDTAPGEAARLLDETAVRLMASADVHRRLHDPALFQRGLEVILQDAVASVVDCRSITVTFDIEPVQLTLDQMSAITMLVIEAANNSQKHVFQPGRGSRLTVALKAISQRRAKLIVRDDGTGGTAPDGRTTKQAGLGLRIMERLARQMGGILTVPTNGGSEVSVELPLRPASPTLFDSVPRD